MRANFIISIILYFRRRTFSQISHHMPFIETNLMIRTTPFTLSLIILLMGDERVLDFFLWLISVAPTPGVVGSIASAFHALLDNLAGDGFQIVGPADFSEEVDERSCVIQFVVTQFGGLVIPWEYMVVVVPAFTEGECCNGDVLHGVDVAIVGL